VSSGELTEGGISAPPVRGMAAALEAAIREEGGRVLALLARRYGDLDLAEEAVATALENAVRTWPRDGVPTNPGGWLLVAARRAAIDRLRHEAGQTRRAPGLATGFPPIPAGGCWWLRAARRSTGCGTRPVRRGGRSAPRATPRSLSAIRRARGMRWVGKESRGPRTADCSAVA